MALGLDSRASPRRWPHQNLSDRPSDECEDFFTLRAGNLGVQWSIYISSHCYRWGPPSDTLTRIRSVRGLRGSGGHRRDWVHRRRARSVRAARGRAPGRRRCLDARSGRAGGGAARRRARRSSRRRPSLDAEDVDVVHICTPNHLHAPLAEAALAPASTSSARSRSRWMPRRRRRLAARLRPATGRQARCRSSTGTTRPCARRASASARENRSGAADPRHVPAGLAAAPGGRQLARRRGAGGASRAFADIGSHWCDLAEFVSGQRITRVCARVHHRRGRTRARRGSRRLRARRRLGRAPDPSGPRMRP